MTHSETGCTINSRKQEKHTPSDSSYSSEIIKNNVVFHPLQNIVFFQGNIKIKNGEEIKREELTKDEEDKFYKKVFKTSIL